MKALRFVLFGVMFLFLGAPLIIIAGVSLNAQNRLFFPPEGISGRWYVQFIQDSAWYGPAINSLLIAALAAFVAVTVALPLAYLVWRTNLRIAKAIYALGLAPFAIPPVITGLGALALWIVLGMYGRLHTVVLTHGIFLVTLPLATITLGFRSIHTELVEAATTMGASNATVFRTIILPLLAPYLVAGYVFAFVLSLNEYIIAFMTVGFTVETLPIKIFNSLRYGYSPIMASVSILFFITSTVLFTLVGLFGNLPKLLGADTDRE